MKNYIGKIYGKLTIKEFAYRNEYNSVYKIRKENTIYHIGRFNTEEEAALAYNEKAIELHGEFAHLNKIE